MGTTPMVTSRQYMSFHLERGTSRFLPILRLSVRQAPRKCTTLKTGDEKTKTRSGGTGLTWFGKAEVCAEPCTRPLQGDPALAHNLAELPHRPGH